MPKCGHTLRRDVTANLLSTILSLWLFHYKLGTRFNFSTRDVCFSDHHTSTLSLSLSLSLSLFLSHPCWVGVSPQGEDGAFYSKSPNLKKTLSTRSGPVFFFPPAIKGVSAATNQKLACKQKHIVCKSMQPSKKIAVKMWNFSGGDTARSALRDLCRGVCDMGMRCGAAIVHPR